MPDITQELIAASHKSGYTWRRRISTTVWVIAILLIGSIATTGESDLSNAQSAPQQAAGAAMACFRLIAIYTMARGIGAICREP